MEEEPKDVMVLQAILSGKTDENKIAKHTRLTLFEVASVVERLILMGLVERTEKNGLLGKKTALKITEKGGSELNERMFELEQKWQKMVLLAKQGDKKQFEEMVAMNKSWIPAMIFMGLIDMMFWMSMLSMMGMAMQDTVPEGYDTGVDEGGGDHGGDFGDLGDIGI